MPDAPRPGRERPTTDDDVPVTALPDGWWNTATPALDDPANWFAAGEALQAGQVASRVPLTGAVVTFASRAG